MKSQKLDKNGNEAEEINAGSDHGGSSSSFTQEDDNASHVNSGGATSTLTLEGKTKASRGSATDSQSLYARVINFFKQSSSLVLYVFIM